jgi:poly-gamma-glutamate synthesis protein (capsule biosynthesis protein)
VRVLLLGDVSLGRRIEPLARNGEALADVRAVLADADIAAANLESPLTNRSATGVGVHLAADPAVVDELARAGIDLAGVANNHAGEAGSPGVADTLRALDRVGIAAVGARARERTAQPVVISAQGVRVAFLAFDATGQGDTGGPVTVETWDAARARRAIARARAAADAVVVGIHGGIEMYGGADPALTRIAELLARWDVDVVWGHGSHVPQPIQLIDPDGDGRPTLVATSLGNALFDQFATAHEGLVLEVLLAADGVVAHRHGTTVHPDGRARFEGWSQPTSRDAVHLAAGWWELVGARFVEPRRRDRDAVGAFAGGDVTDAVVGDIDENGELELVVAFRKPGRVTPAQIVDPEWPWTDDAGRTAHLGRYRLRDLEPLWVASTLARPVTAVAACAGSIAVKYAPVGPLPAGGGAWIWKGFSFRPAVDVDGAGTPGCVDVDGDGRAEPAILDRRSP